MEVIIFGGRNKPRGLSIADPVVLTFGKCIRETEYRGDQNDLIRHVTDSAFLDLVSVLETEYGSDQNDLIRHVTDSVFLGLVSV